MGFRHSCLRQIRYDLRRRQHLILVFRTDVLCPPIPYDLSILYPYGTVAHVGHVVYGMGDEDHGLPAPGKFLEMLLRLGHECGVTDTEDLVHQHYVGIHIHHDRERQSSGHPRGVCPDRVVYVLGYPRVLDYPVDLGIHLLAAEPIQLPFEVYVLPPGHILMEAHSELKDRCDLPGTLYRPGIRLHYPGYHGKEGTLPASVPSQNPQNIAFSDIQRDSVQDLVLDGLSMVPVENAPFLLGVLHLDLECLHDVPDLYGVLGVHLSHNLSANPRLSLRNTASPNIIETNGSMMHISRTFISGISPKYTMLWNASM